MTANIAMVLARILLGGLFLLAGGAKLLQPTAEFQAALANYRFIPLSLQGPLATGLPWIELLTGGFVLVGLYTRQALAATGLLLILFTTSLLLAWAMGADLSDCGCFGGISTLDTGQVAIVRNLILLPLTYLLWRRTSYPWSLDRLLR